MSKKDYQAMARVLYSVRRFAPYEGGQEHMLSEVTREVANVFAADNPRFDRARFIEACETGRCKGMPR